MLILALLGMAGAVRQWWDSIIRPWLDADPAHWWLVAVGLVCLLALGALYGREKEDDELVLAGLRVKIAFFRPEVLPAHPYSQAHVFTDVLSLRFGFEFINNSSVDVTPQLKEPCLQQKRGRTWFDIPITLGDECMPYLVLYNAYRTPSRVIKPESLHIRTLMPGGASSYVGKQLRIVLRFAIPGQRDAALKQIFSLEPTPPADPPPSTASEQAPPS